MTSKEALNKIQHYIFDIKQDFKQDFKQDSKQLSDFLNTIQEKYISQLVASFDDFCIDELYKYYQQLGFTKIFVVNRTEFKKFILWALPLWEKRCLKNE